MDHGRDDTLGIAGSAPGDELVILAGREVGRDGVHVSGKGNKGYIAELRKDVEAMRFDFDSLDGTLEPRSERRQVVMQEHSHTLLIGSDGLDVNQGPCQLEYVHRRIHGQPSVER